MEMQNVLDKLREIENPSEDQQAAITSATKMTQAPEIDAAVVETTATGDNVYQQYAPTTEPNDIAKLAGLETLAVVTDPTPTVESAEKEGKPITEAQSPAQKAAFQKMLDANKSKTKDKDEDEDKEEVEESIEVHEDDAQEIAEGPTRKDFQMVADLIKGQSDPAKKKELAQHQADVFATQNPRFDRDKFMMASGVMESQDLEEAYDPSHVADIIKKHEETGHQVELDSYKDDQAGFTVTFLDGKRRHYLYTQTGSKVTSLEPVDPLIDPNAPKRGRGRPTKEGEEVEEGDNIYHPCTKSFTHERFGEGTVIHGEHTLAEDGTVTHYDAEFVKEDGTRYVVKNIPVANMKGAVQVEHSHPAKKRKNEGIEEEVDELTRTFEAKLAEALPEEAEVITESIQVNQNINDDGQESVSINAQGNQEHLDMLKSLLALAGQSRGYDEYQGKEEVVEPEQEAPVEENLANSPDPKYADVDTQLNKQAGGLNKPKKAYAKAQDGDNAMAVEESMFDLYKEYKGE